MTQDWKASGDGEDDVQMPLGTGGGDSEIATEEYAERRPRINNSTLALFAAFGAALVVLYLLGLGNKPRAVSAEEESRQTKVNNAIEEMIRSKDGAQNMKTLMGNTSNLVKILMTYLGSKPADAIELDGDNPFERNVTRSDITDTNATQRPVEIGPDPRMRQVAEVFAGLRLTSVMIGPTPAALISQGTKQRMVTVGAKIDPLVVSDIQRDRVLLSFEKATFVLKLNVDPTEKP